MRKKNCELCGHSEPGFMEMYEVAPREIAEGAAIKQSKVVRLC